MCYTLMSNKSGTLTVNYFPLLNYFFSTVCFSFCFSFCCIHCYKLCISFNYAIFPIWICEISFLVMNICFYRSLVFICLIFGGDYKVTVGKIRLSVLDIAYVYMLQCLWMRHNDHWPYERLRNRKIKLLYKTMHFKNRSSDRKVWKLEWRHITYLIWGYKQLTSLKCVQ